MADPGMHPECAEHVGMIDRREEERGDRPVGLARSQVRAVHAHRRYDVEVDTAWQSVEECAEVVVKRVAAGPGEAFPALRSEGVR